MKSVDTLIEIFHQHGLKVTPQRRLIFDLLVVANGHPTVDEIYQRVLSVMPDVSRTTIYNTLRELVALGQLVEVGALSEGSMRYDTNCSHHHHLFCMRCHNLVDIDLHISDLELPPEKASGYQIVKSQVTFYGICPACQKE